MARVALTKTTAARNLTGVSLTALSFTTLTLGTNNGRYWSHLPTDVLLLKNDAGSPAVYTFVFAAGAEYTRYGMTIASPTITVADGKTVAVRLGELLLTAGQVLLDCSVAGKAAVLDCTG